MSTLLAEALLMLPEPPRTGAAAKTDNMLTCRVAYSSLSGREESGSHSPHFNCLSLLRLPSVATLPAFGWVVELLITDLRRPSLGTSLGIPLREKHHQRSGPEVTAWYLTHIMKAQIPKPEICKERNEWTTCHQLFSLPFHLPFLTSFPHSLLSNSVDTGRDLSNSNSKCKSLLLLEGLSSKDLR